MSLPALDEATLDSLYQWLDRIPFSRERNDIAKDFSDGVLLAELIHNFVPRIVDLHNYTAATASVQKRYNWTALNKRVLAKLGCQLPNHVVQHVISCKPGAIEYVLLNVKAKIHSLTSQKDFKMGCHQDFGFHQKCTPSSNNSSRASSANGSLESLSMGSPDTVIAVPRSGYLSLSASTTPRMGRKGWGKQQIEKVPAPGGGDDLIPSGHLFEAKKDILVREEQIQVLQARITHLENLSELKQERIDDLTNRLDRLSHELFRQHNYNWTGALSKMRASTDAIDQINIPGGSRDQNGGDQPPQKSPKNLNSM